MTFKIPDSPPVYLQMAGRVHRPWTPYSYRGVWRMGDRWDGELWQFSDRPLNVLLTTKCRQLGKRYTAIEIRLRNGQLCRYMLKVSR